MGSSVPEEQTSLNIISLEKKTDNSKDLSMLDLVMLEKRVAALEVAFQEVFKPLSIETYAKRYLKPNHSARTPCLSLYRDYRGYCLENCRTPESMSLFTSKINKLYPTAGFLLDGALYYRLVAR